MRPRPTAFPANAPGFLRAARAPAAFTLLEMMLAIAILIILTVTVYQFVGITIRATDVSLRLGEDAMRINGFRRLVASQLASLPAGQNGSLVGMEIKGKDGRGRRDALSLVCPAGNAVLTPDARGFYQVTLDLHEIPRGSGHYALGMERQPWTDDDDDDDDDAAVLPGTPPKSAGLHAAGTPLPSDWVLLLDDVKSLEIAYFDARLNGWVDRWPDTSLLPNLVRLRVALGDDGAPLEIVERVPGGGIARLSPGSIPAQPIRTRKPGEVY